MTMVIAGAGLAGAKAAETLRAEGYSGRVVLMGEENERPYERPPLSKGLLLRTAERESVYVHEAGWYEANNVELRLGTRLTGLEPQAKQVTLADGESLGYEKLLLATGSRPRRLEMAGGRYLRTLADSDAIDAELTEGKRVVIVGAGWIGLEIAAAARNRGADVTVVEMARLPLQRVLGDEVAQIFADLHRANGVTFHFGAHVTQDFVTSLNADLLVVGVGIKPNVELAQLAGLSVDNGVVVDESLRTSDPDIFAAGDVANAYHPLLRRHIRVEHWANALNSAPAAARAMLGQSVSYELLPYFYTDQYDLGMEYSGYVTPDGYDQVVFRGSVDTREFLAFWTQEGRVLAGMNVNIWDVQDDIQALVRAGYAGKPVDLAKLADADVPLADLTS
jgi:3-phenylpropionate/trans-cinnamate dioxygenase ferredoxin reductase component